PLRAVAGRRPCQLRRGARAVQPRARPVPGRAVGGGGMPRTSGEVDSRYVVPALSRGLALLGTFSAERTSLTLSQISKAVGLSRSSSYRLVYTLEEMGFLLRDKSNKAYRLGTRILGLGFAYLASPELVELARPHLEALRDRTNCSAHLGVVE